MRPSTASAPSPFIEISRSDWASLGRTTDSPLTQEEIEKLRGLGDFLDLEEVRDIYLPLSQLLNYYVQATAQLHSSTTSFLGDETKRTPFVIGIAGSVAVGKSTVARLLLELLQRWPGTPQVELITTDGFLYPNAELEARGILNRKGFPESYDRLALLEFVSEVKSGVAEVSAPVYSHLYYDIMPGQKITVKNPDVLIVEGLNVLQPPGKDQETALSDYFDFGIYVNANSVDVNDWFIARFKKLRESAFTNPNSYFHRYSEMPAEQALDRAQEIWQTINLPNLLENIQPTRSRATLVLHKGKGHKVESVSLRKL